MLIQWVACWALFFSEKQFCFHVKYIKCGFFLIEKGKIFSVNQVLDVSFNACYTRLWAGYFWTKCKNMPNICGICLAMRRLTGLSDWGMHIST